MKPRSIQFRVPMNGVSYPVKADVGLMCDRQEGLNRFRFAWPMPTFFPGGDRPQLAEAIMFVNNLIDNGVPWSALATCRRGSGAISALIEAGHNRLNETAGHNDAA